MERCRQNEAKFLKQIAKLNSLVLKTVETLYKKYFVENETRIRKISADEPGSFGLECLVNLVRDVELLDVRSINALLVKLARVLSNMIHSGNSEFLTGLIGEFKTLKAYLDLFTAFAMRW